MKESTAWRRIAGDIDEGLVSLICPAIWRSGEPVQRRSVMESRVEIFKPYQGAMIYWRTDEEGRNCRVLACLFLAAMTEKP